MPKKKKTYSKPGYKSCGKMVYSDAKRALAIAKQVKRMINVEYKIIDTVRTEDVCAVAGFVRPLVLLSQGDGNANRDGNQIKITNIYFKYWIQASSAASASATRVMLVIDKQPNGALFTLAQLLKNVTVIDAINSPLHEDFRRRFRILYDRRHFTDDSRNQISSGFYSKSMQLPIRYSGTAGDITDLSETNLCLVHLSDEATNEPLLNAFVRILFVDN